MWHINISNFGWPQWTYLAMVALGLGMSAYRHGKPRKVENYDFFKTVFYTMIWLNILLAGGFWG